MSCAPTVWADFVAEVSCGHLRAMILSLSR
jgi:hypothetical protein